MMVIIRGWLMRCALAQSDQTTAVTELESLLPRLLTLVSTPPIIEPFRLVPPIYELLCVLEDGRATAVLQQAQARLRAKAAQIQDPLMAQTFLAVPEHHLLLHPHT
jgi:hypothetical protein